jgi:hypothetical protein
VTYFPPWLETAIADARQQPVKRGNETILDARNRPKVRESEFGKPPGDVSVPTPGRHTPKPTPHVEVSRRPMPRPSVNGR